LGVHHRYVSAGKARLRLAAPYAAEARGAAGYIGAHTHMRAQRASVLICRFYLGIEFNLSNCGKALRHCQAPSEKNVITFVSDEAAAGGVPMG
jgi:hypothetical protein